MCYLGNRFDLMSVQTALYLEVNGSFDISSIYLTRVFMPIALYCAIVTVMYRFVATWPYLSQEEWWEPAYLMVWDYSNAHMSATILPIQ